MCGLRRVGSLSSVAGLLLVLAVLPLLAQQPPPKPPEKKPTARKVWTNDDIPQLQQSQGVSVVGTAPAPKETAQPGTGQGPAKEEPKNFYSDLTLKERQPWIDKLEAEIAKLEARATDLRGQFAAATTDEERTRLNNEIEGADQAITADRAELETIRNTPPPKPPKKAPAAKPKAPAPAQAAPK